MKQSDMTTEETAVTMICISMIQALMFGDDERLNKDYERLGKVLVGCRKIDCKDLCMLYAVKNSAGEDDLLEGGDHDPDMSLVGNCLVTLGNIIQ